MSLSPGTSLGHYDVTALIGEGLKPIFKIHVTSILGFPSNCCTN